ncbi:DUF6468 domain-containing protein [Azospirillum sp. SYSU D00513]|uniref:DUF6468 domain-containing protein n=1 Tax=Azospirillum sp. SYSU D00513 TaxID=2812561 RepID=UPI001A967E25|nr:DUF6468 domain-containing protein [Azospirillum sp. SYSU D00513]
MSPNLSLILDLVMVGLLAATIAYAIILNKQIIRLRESRGEMAELIVGLNEAMSKAETGVRGMKKTASDTGEDLQRAIGKAQALRDELHFMLETGEGLANRLSGSSGGGGERAKAPARPLAPGPRPLAATRPPAEDGPLPVKRSLAASPPPAPLREAGEQDTITREGETLSRAERELLQAIENRR